MNITWQEIKDSGLTVGVLLTFIASAWNLLLTYRAATESRFINTVTAERVKWMMELRTNMSKFCGSVHSWMTIYGSAPGLGKGPTKHKPDPQELELLKEIDRLRYLIRLQLDPSYDLDKEIERLIITIPNLTNSITQDDLRNALEELTQKTQAHLNNEWQKIKVEARKGKLGRKIARWTNPK